MSVPIELAEDTYLDALFRPTVEPPFEQRVCYKSQRSSHTTEAGDEARAKKRERSELERARRASLADEELHQQRSQEMVVGAFSPIP